MPQTDKQPQRSIMITGLMALAACSGEANLVDAASQELGVIPVDPVVRGRDGGYSARFGGRSVWCFGDTALQWAGVDGETWRTSTAAFIDDPDPSDGLDGFIESGDASGVPIQLLPFTADEAAYNASYRPCPENGTCDPIWVLWPGQLVVDPQTGAGLLFYMKVLDWNDVGRGIALWPAPTAPVTRPEVRPGETEPTLIFTGDDPRLGNAALVVENGDGGVDWLYAYSCDHQGGFEFRCELGRAPLAEVLVRDAWEFFAGDGAWSADHRDAVKVMDGSSILSIFYNGYLGEYMAVYSDENSNAKLRIAPAPEGPWSGEQTIHHAIEPGAGGGWIYDLLAHPELSPDDGKTLHLSYSRTIGFFQTEMRFVEVELL